MIMVMIAYIGFSNNLIVPDCLKIRDGNCQWLNVECPQDDHSRYWYGRLFTINCSWPKNLHVILWHKRYI